MIVGYSEVLQVMAAMVLFSLILITSNKMILLNSKKGVETESEQKAITLAQNLINEARLLPFDANTTGGPLQSSEIPDGFSATGPGSGETTRADFNDFDDYHTFTNTFDWQLRPQGHPDFGESVFTLSIKVLYVQSPDFKMSGGSETNYTEFKKMVVTVTSDYLTDNNGDPIKIEMPYLRRYYKRAS
ncbi:hypothetical protein LX73_0975 [Fodinibius salinus]|uniref:Type II secretion system protein n=1 Tax=Fodinibius salinus TaxID=860790 RepID=A0A5D3YNY6_9BACT|nr:hypothetical protein [Fodinibius salinus]TYP95660.1 hypothetical protein LX73_0975 [Fodinibius salinus]